ncbi:MAG: DUF4091 domain-containing protein, partial [Thermoguttaceae bacterium]|nr:DUF4091 domain-containing protein [Thermoguttaceae bacterium]
MKNSRYLSVLAFLVVAFALRVEARAQTFEVWTLNVHSKIFADSLPTETSAIAISAASNEYESAQFALRSSVDQADVSIIPSDLTNEETGQKIDASNVRIRRVGMLPVTKNTPNADEIVVRKVPCDFPDILYDESVVSLKADETTGIWVTVFVPKGSSAGNYVGKILIKNANVEKELPISLEVFSFELPDARSLYMTNWWSPWNVASYHKLEYFSEEHWEMMEKYFKNMGEHRQNVLIVEWTPDNGHFIKGVCKEDGTFEFDFSLFERLLRLAEKHGVADRIELQHIGGIDRTRHSVSFHSATFFDEKKQEDVVLSVDEWLEPSLKALCDYLKKTGRLERSMIHVADEPYLPDIESWRVASERIRNIAPELKQIDAIETMNFTNRLDVWVPKLSHFDRWRQGFEARRGDGEFWYYICCHPIGIHYPNRFMDIPGARIRVLHWINYSENLVGYLHWGYNHWQGDAFGAPTETYGPGDTHIVYPGPNGPLDSIRWELERESVEDYEYLKLLEKSVAQYKSELDSEKSWAIDPKSRAMELARKIVPDLTHTTMDGELIERTRLEVAKEIEAATGDLRLIVQTFPEDGRTIYSGPNLVELYGVTTPGASITINGEK